MCKRIDYVTQRNTSFCERDAWGKKSEKKYFRRLYIENEQKYRKPVKRIHPLRVS